MKRLIALRKQYQAFGRGTLEFLTPTNHRVLAFVRELDGDETILVVANLSRFAQYVELDLSRGRGLRPVELFGHTEFPPIGELPYLLTLGGHGFYWFSLEPPRRAEDERAGRRLRAARSLAAASAASLLRGRRQRALEEALPGFLRDPPLVRRARAGVTGASRSRRPSRSASVTCCWSRSSTRDARPSATCCRWRW